MNEVEPNRLTQSTGQDLATPVTRPKKAVIAAITVLTLLVLGLLFWWFISLQISPVTPPYQRPTAAENNEPESTTAEAQVETMGALSTSDELSTISADLESTNLDMLETDASAIESELEAAVVDQ